MTPESSDCAIDSESFGDASEIEARITVVITKY
jgi:hypothetical protein